MTTTLFRCDAHRSIGLGHLSRCLTLAGALRSRGVDSVFAMQDRDARLGELVTSAGHCLHLLEVEPQEGFAKLSAADVHATRALAEQHGASWLVVDTYGATSEHFRAWRGDAWRLAALDDLGERDLSPCALVVNPTYGCESWTHRVSSATTVLAGAAFCLLAPVFAQLRASQGDPVGSRALHHVLVALGALDPGGWTIEVLRLLQRHHPSCQVRAILGDRDADRAKHAAAGPASTRILPLQSPDELAQQMLWADLAIATPSTIAWELACLRVPAILHVVADNQRLVAAELNRGALASISHDIEGLEAHIADAQALLADSPRLARWVDVCDGGGAERVADFMLTPPHHKDS